MQVGHTVSVAVLLVVTGIGTTVVLNPVGLGVGGGGGTEVPVPVGTTVLPFCSHQVLVTVMVLVRVMGTVMVFFPEVTVEEVTGQSVVTKVVVFVMTAAGSVAVTTA
jgi:hypothetical protein